MGWSISHEGAAARILKKLVRCNDCEYCLTRKTADGLLMRVNDCAKQANLPFFRDIPHLCKYYKKHKKQGLKVSY